MQILHDNGGNFSDDDAINSSADVLLDGRLLCRVANGIAAGSVEAAFEDESDNVRENRARVVLTAVSELQRK